MAVKATAVVYEGPEKFEIKDFPLPALGPGDMLVEVILCGVDGSELHMYRGEFEWLNDVAPVIFGDEILGRVVEIGEDVKAARGLQVGDRVVVESRWPCQGCRTCDSGQYYLCERRGSVFEGYGTLPSAEPPHLWGGYATHTFVPAEALAYKVPEELSDTTALIACSPLANGIRWVEAGRTKEDDHVVVVGPGTQGLACALAAVRLGARVSIVGLESDRERLRIAEVFGVAGTFTIAPDDTVADTVASITAANGPVDVTIETAGAGSAKDLALQLLRPLGVMVNVSVASPANQPVNWMTLLQREITVVNPMSHPHTVDRAFALAVKLLDDGIDIGTWITHTFGLPDAATAIATASYQLEARPVKVALSPAL